MQDRFDGLKIGMIVTEQFLNNGTMNSSAFGIAYNLLWRQDLTAQSNGVLNAGNDDNSNVYQVIENIFFAGDDVTYAVNKGKLFVANYVFKSVANNDYARIHIKANNKICSMQLFIDSEGKAYIKTYLNTIYSNNGTQLSIFNRNCLSSIVNTAKVYTTPTITTLGTLRTDDLITGGSGGNAVGSGGGSRSKTIIGDTQDLLFEAQNVSGQVRDMSLVIVWYEE